MTHAGTRDANEAPIIYRCYELERFILCIIKYWLIPRMKS